MVLRHWLWFLLLTIIVNCQHAALLPLGVFFVAFSAQLSAQRTLRERVGLINRTHQPFGFIPLCRLASGRTKTVKNSIFGGLFGVLNIDITGFSRIMSGCSYCWLKRQLCFVFADVLGAECWRATRALWCLVSFLLIFISIFEGKKIIQLR